MNKFETNTSQEIFSLIVTPNLTLVGGVSSIWSEISREVPRLRLFEYSKSSGITTRLIDTIRFLIIGNKSHCLFNTSLMTHSLIRDWFLSLFTDNYSIFWHGWDPSLMDAKVYRIILRMYLRRSIKVFVLSKAQEKQIYSLIDIINVQLVPTCSPVVQYSRNEGYTKPLRVLFCSRLEKTKGISELMTIISKLPDLELHVCGGGAEERLVENFAKNHENIYFYGYVRGEMKHELFTKCNVTCLPTSYPEGLPVNLIEAASYGHYIVSTRNAGITDHFCYDEMGELIDMDDWLELKRVLCGITREKLQIAEKFNVSYHSKNWTPKALYNQLIQL